MTDESSAGDRRVSRFGFRAVTLALVLAVLGVLLFAAELRLLFGGDGPVLWQLVIVCSTMGVYFGYIGYPPVAGT
jgi:hypothetical protein